MDPNPYEAPQSIAFEAEACPPTDTELFWWIVVNVAVLTAMLIVSVLGQAASYSTAQRPKPSNLYTRSALSEHP
jgi:hypothetical protein